MAAQQTDAVFAGYNYLLRKEDLQGLSLVFKVKPTNFEGYDFDWRNFVATPGDEDFKYLLRCHQLDLDRDPEEGGSGHSSHVDSSTRDACAVLTACVKKCLFAVFQAKQIEPKSVTWFIQTEIGKDAGMHVHVLVAGPGFNPSQGKWIQRTLNIEYARWLVSCLNIKLSVAQRVKLRTHIETNRWVDLLVYQHKSTRKWYCRPVNYSDIIAFYFLAKNNWATDPTHCYIRCWDNEEKLNHLSITERLAVHRMFVEKSKQPTESSTDTVDAPQSTEGPAAKKKRIETQKELNIKECVEKLVQQRIVNQEDWMFKDPDTYVQVLAMPSGENLVKNILDISGLRVSRGFTAMDLLLEKPADPEFAYPGSKLWQIFESNRFNPIKCLHAIMCVLNKQSGKRNTVLFFGPASTGKSLIAQQMCAEIGNVGCYNPANVNFPFNDCTNKNIIWVEESCNFGQQVNQFKAICSGQTIRVDQKGKGSKPIFGTPVVMTTNEDITRVIIGCEERPEHSDPIKQRMVGFNLTAALRGDFGLLETGSFAKCCQWMARQGYQPTMANYLEEWDNLPQWGEDWSTPTKARVQPAADTSLDEIRELVQALETDLAAQAAEFEPEDLDLFDVNLQLSPETPEPKPAERSSSPAVGGLGAVGGLVEYSDSSSESKPTPEEEKTSRAVSDA